MLKLLDIIGIMYCRNSIWSIQSYSCIWSTSYFPALPTYFLESMVTTSGGRRKTKVCGGIGKN